MIIDAKKKREEFAENEKHYMNIIRVVFDIQYLKREESNRMSQLENAKYEIFSTPDENGNNAIAIRKHPIKKVTDLTMENILHLEAWEVLELISNNMGTGWKGLPLAIQDIIESAFFVDCTIMPVKTMRKEGGIIEKRKEDGYEVLEIERGTWIEGVFMKPKPRVEKVHTDYSIIDDDEDGRKKHRKDIDDDLELGVEEEEEDMDEEELKKLDGEKEEEDMDDEEPDENTLHIEDIEVIDAIDEIDEEED